MEKKNRQGELGSTPSILLTKNNDKAPYNKSRFARRKSLGMRKKKKEKTLR